MDWDFIVWICINIFIPALAPVLLLLMPKIPRKTRPYAKGVVLKAIQDGQLFWVSTAQCSVGLYEFYTYFNRNMQQTNHVLAWFCVLTLGAILLASVTLVLLQALDFNDMPERLDHGLIMASIILLGVAAAISCYGHYLAAQSNQSATLIQDRKER